MNQIFRLSRTARRDPVVTAWLNEQPDELGAIARHWFDVMRGCGDDVRVVVHDDQPTACVADAAFAYVDAYTEHVNVGFFHGATLDDPAGLLQGTGKRMRHVKLHPGREVDAAALSNLINAAYVDIRARLGAEQRRSAAAPRNT